MVLCLLLSQKSSNNAHYSFKIKLNKREAPDLSWFVTREENILQSMAYEKKHFEHSLTHFTTHTAHSIGQLSI